MEVEQFNRVISGVKFPDNDAYLAHVADIISNEKFQSMSRYIQHGETTCLSHCIWVSYYSYLLCEKFGWDSRSAARAGLLHDFFLYDWHDKSEKRGALHGFTHPKTACENASREFHLNRRESDIILKHMWPLTIVPPRYKESFVIMHFDRLSCIQETKIGIGISNLFVPKEVKENIKAK